MPTIHLRSQPAKHRLTTASSAPGTVNSNPHSPTRRSIAFHHIPPSTHSPPPSQAAHRKTQQRSADPASIPSNPKPSLPARRNTPPGPHFHNTDNMGPRTPTHERILNRLNSGIQIINTAHASPTNDHDIVLLDPPHDHPQPSLRYVLEMIEDALELTLVTDDKSVDLNDLESKLLAWKHKHMAPPTTARRLSLVERAGSPTSTCSSLTADLLQTRKALIDQRTQTEHLKTELASTQKELSRRNVQWRDQDAKHRAEIAQLKTTIEQTKQLSKDQQKDFWDELTQYQTKLKEQSDESAKCRKTMAQQKSELERIQAQCREFQTQCEELSESLDRGRKEAFRVQNEKSRLEKEVAEMRSELDNALQEVERGTEVVRRTTASHADVQALQTQVVQLDADLNESKEQRTVLNNHLHSVKHELETVRLQLNEANRREDQLRVALSGAEKRAHDLDLAKGQLEDKLHQTKTTARKRDGDYFSASQMLDGRSRELNELSDKYQQVVGEREQLASIRREMQIQLDKARSELQRSTGSERKLTTELERVRAVLHEITESNSEVKRHVSQLQAAKKGAEREGKELKTKVAELEAAQARLVQELASTRKDLERETLTKLEVQDRVDKLQTRLQNVSARDTEVQRELQGTRIRLEDKTNELETLKMQWKQLLADHRDIDHRLKSADTRIVHAQNERDTLKTQLVQEGKQFQEKLAYAMTQINELDKQLVEAKTNVGGLTSDRDRLRSETKKLLARLDKYQDRVSQSDARAEKLVEERNRYERKVRELNKYRTLYENVLEARVMSAAPRPTAASLVDWDVVTEHQQLVSRCRRIIQSAAQYTTTLNHSDAMHAENLTTTEDILEALEVVFSSLCAQLAHYPAPLKEHSGSRRRSLVGETDMLLQIHRQCVHVVDQVRGPVADLVNHRLVNEDVLTDLDVARCTLNEVRGEYRRNSGASAYSSTSSGVNTLVSGSSDVPKQSAKGMGVVQAVTALIKIVAGLCCSTSDQLLAKYKTVVLQVQSKVEHQLRALEAQLTQCRAENSRLKDKLARTSYLSDRAMLAKRKAQANAAVAL